MDLKKNIEIAFGVYWKNLPVTIELNTGTHLEAFIEGAKSQAAKDFWYNEFKRQKIQSDSGQDQSLRNQPMKPSECFNGKSEHVMVYGTGSDDGPNDKELELWQKQIVEPTYLYNEFVEYRKAHQEEEISYREWADKFVHIVDKTQVENGKQPYYPPGTVQSDPLYGAINKVFDNVTPKNVDITDHIDHDEPIRCVIIGVGSQMIIREPIESIVPVADVVPEQIISKQELLEMHDKAVECSIANETFKESRAWDIKKQKKVSHKRNNKRK